MASKRITISVSEELAERIKEAAGDKPVSTWVSEVVQEHLLEAYAEELWDEYMAEVEIPEEAREWAERVIQSAVSPGEAQGRHNPESHAA